MPIYEYLCNSCGVEDEHLQKMSDAPIATCSACGSSDYTKLISAAGFQLKGSGWYATDFKNSKKPLSEPKKATKTSEPKKETTTSAKESTATPAATKSDKPSASAAD